ncbi:ADP-ribosyltransferase domain-containing protein [Mucilaginibacter sp.]|jgi:hypothetical protein|uniref:ADP-ribosyltransferase domain-containing protein n=1 Tax=Mucilaginibacter sp. TaxID=1882438 RepID=UPI002CFC4271|nr:ADP-ribosyltransferase domain-containing protein [Mucilaginibacter sp.]HTI58263.1 ADP-ribosyltransferase domain-containing protein [Mucilaginibacter sp.]
MHLEEPIILHNCLERHPYLHWLEHYHSLVRRVNGEPPTYHIREHFEKLRQLIAEALSKSGFNFKGKQIEKCATEDELNSLIIYQYTDESDLYKTVNDILRACHAFHDFDASAENNEYDEPLAPWILQLNSCIRKLPHFEGKAYRGTVLSSEDIAQYKVGEMFIWAPFVSASKDITRCFGGNVIFEITNQEHFMGLNDKGYPRDISALSIFPEEAEVLYPVSCAFRIDNLRQESDYTLIELKALDSY